MKNQEWFERFKVRLGLDENYFQPPSEEQMDQDTIQSVLLKMALQTLSRLERKIITMIFFEGYSERKVALRLGLPKTKLHRLKKKALRTLSKSIYLKLKALSNRMLPQK